VGVIIDTQALQVPQAMQDHWQKTVDLMAAIVNIPAALIMRIHPDEIEVFTTSNCAGNPYAAGDKERLGHGLYCETVVDERKRLTIANALEDPDWCNNPDIKLGMISYCGVPLNWPDGSPFGTLCMLDAKRHDYDDNQVALLERFCDTIQVDLQILYQQARLLKLNLDLEARVQERTEQLQQLNQQLSSEIDRRSAAESILNYQKFYDPLTELPNRQAFVERLSERLGAAESGLAVVYLGLSQFKAVNHTYGHDVADQLLVMFSEQLRHLDQGQCFCARADSDEFLLLVRGAAVDQLAASLIDKLMATLASGLDCQGNLIKLSLNAGIASASVDCREARELVQQAGAAMLEAKHRNSLYHYYSGDTRTQVDERANLAMRLTDALRLGELELYFQPLVCTATHKLLGAEALLRWFSPQLGAVGPDKFIPLAEQSGQIIEIGNFVLREAIKQAARWSAQLGSDFRVAVNISPRQFRDHQLALRISQLLKVYKLPATALELEITEGVLLQDTYQAKMTITALQKLGVRVSLDDFGTGYSSLSYLQAFSFDTLKIDRSFLADIATNKKNQLLVRVMVSIAKKLNMHLVAEGIETEQQSAFIQAMGCDIGQGYLYGKPMPAAEFGARYSVDSLRH